MSGAVFVIGLYVGIKQIWPIAQAQAARGSTGATFGTDGSVRPLAQLSGKIEIACPIQDEKTAVLLLIGQPNAANSQAQRYQSGDDRVVNFVDGRCYRAASPLLGADGQKGETWTLLGNKLVQAGLYDSVILIPAAVGGSSVRRWAAGGDLNAMLMAVIGGSNRATP